MDNNNINIEEIMADIRKKIKDEGLTADMLSFEDVPYKKPGGDPPQIRRSLLHGTLLYAEWRPDV